MTFTKREFRGGMRQQFVPDKEDAASSYQLLINGRPRTNNIEPIRLPVEDTSLPSGLKQAVYSFDKYILAFVAGSLYTKAEGANNWVPISGVSMSPTAPRIYVERIPASYLNFGRDAQGTVTPESPTRQTPAGLICMDGVTQPVVVFPDGTARATQSWAQWTKAAPEYVPIGRFPMMHNGKLYCVIQDKAGRWTQIAHSVSGQPTNFVILINNNGEKAGAEEEAYGAPALSYAVSYDEITALARINAAEGNFLVTTTRASYLVRPDYDRTIAAEPTFSNQPLFSVGAIGPESITDLNGNTAVVSPEGIRTFNGVAQIRWEGRNDPIIRNIQNLFDSRLQSYGSTVQYDNYVGFALETVYGNGIVWWDDTLGQFVSLDLYPGAARIAQFAVVNTPAVRALYFITADNRLFRAYSGAFAETRLVLQSISSGSAGGAVAVQAVTCNFEHTATNGHWSVHAVADSQIVEGGTREIAGVDVPANRGNASGGKVMLPAYAAARTSIEIRWVGGAKLSGVDVDFAAHDGVEVEPFDTVTGANEEEKFILVSDDGVVNDNRNAVHEAIVAERNVTAYIGAGDHIYYDGNEAEFRTRMKPYWDRARKNAPFYACAGNHDIDSADGGLQFFSYMQQFAGRSGYVRFKHAEFFFFDTGIKTSGTQVNPDNFPSISTGAQANALVAAIKASTARNKIVVWHHPAYTSGSSYAPGIAAMQPLLQRVIDAGATAVVNGHTHLYERIVNIIPQFTVGTGGHPLHGIGPQNANSKRIIPTYGYVRLRVNPVRAVFEFVDIFGTVRDKFLC